MARHRLALATIIVAWGALACGDGGDNHGTECGDGEDFSSRVVVRDQEGNTDNVMPSGPLDLEYLFTSCMDRTVHLLYGPTRQINFEIVRASDGNASLPWQARATIFDLGPQDEVAPGETLIRSSLWFEAPQAGPGEYIAKGWLGGCRTEPKSGVECPGEASVRFTIAGD